MKPITSLLLLAVAVFAAGIAPAGQASGPYKVNGPYKHGALQVYLLRLDVGAAHRDHDYLPVEAAVRNGTLRITETGAVGKLKVVNHGDRPVLIQLGDLLRGGMQDRVVTGTVLVAARSGPQFIDVHCVEADRWAPASSGMHFAAAGLMPYPTQLKRYGQAGTWAAVAAYQNMLSESYGRSVVDQRHPTSLPRTLKKLKEASEEDVATSMVPIDGATGYVAVKGGRVVAAQQFGSSAVLRNSWSKLLESAAVAGVLASSGSGSITSIADVEAFVEESAKAGLVTDAVGPDGALLHRAFNVHMKEQETHGALRRWLVTPSVLRQMMGQPPVR